MRKSVPALPEHVEILVDGQPLTVHEDGTALYKTKARTSGSEVIEVITRITNPLTGEVIESHDVFEYEVLE